MARRTDRSEDSRDHQPSPRRPKRDFTPSLEALEQRMVLSTYELSVALRDTPVLPPESPFSVSSRTPDGQEIRMTDYFELGGVNPAGQGMKAKGETGNGAWAVFSDAGDIHDPINDIVRISGPRAVIAPGHSGNGVVAAWTAPAKGKADIYMEVRNVSTALWNGFTFIGEVRTALGNVMTLGQGILTSDQRAVLTTERLKLETEPGDSVRIIVLPDGKSSTKDGRLDFAETTMQVEYEPEPILVQPLLDIEDTSPPPPGAIAKLSATESLSYADEAAGTLFTVQRWENELLDRQRTLDHIMEPLPGGPTAEDLQIQTMTKTLESYQTELANLPVYEADLKKQLADTTALITQLTNQINALTALINQCTTQISALTAQIAVTPIAQRPPLVAQRSALLVQRADYAAQRTALQTQKTAASALVKTLKTQIAAIPARRKFLQATIPTLTAQLAALRAWRAVHPTYREQLQTRRDAVDAALDDVFLLKHSSRSLLEQTGAEIDDTERRAFAPTVINGTWLTAQTQGWIDDIADASRVGQMVQEVLAESVTESPVTVAGSATVTNDTVSVPISLPLLGGTGIIGARRLDRNTSLDIAETSDDLQVRLARLQEGGTVEATPIGSRIAWTTPYGTDFERRAVIDGIGNVLITSTMRYDWSHQYYPSQYAKTAASGNLVMDHPDGSLYVYFAGPVYVQGLAVSVLGTGDASAIILGYEDGSRRFIQLTSGGIVPIGEEVVFVALSAGKGMQVELQNIDARSSTPAATEPDVPEDAQVIDGGVGYIDLSGAGSFVTGVSGYAKTFTNQAELYATAYRGETALQTVRVGDDGSYTVEDPNGITSVVFTGAQCQMIVYGTTVEGVQGTPQVSAAAVESETNNTVAVATAPQIADFTWNTGNNSILGMLGINRGGGSMNNWLYSRLGYLVYTRPTEYLIVRIRGGNEKFRSLRYFDEDAQPRDYPSDGYEVHGNFLIVHPAPHRDLWLDFDGSYLVSDITASAREAIMPPINPTPVLDLLIRRPLVSYEGNWGAYITEIRSGSNAFGAFKGIFNIENRGQNGITFEEIRVHIGSTGTTADPITYTLAEHKDLPGGGTASLALPVDADPTQSNQLWSISALTNTGEVIVLRGGSGFLPPRPRGSDPTRDAHTIRMIIENGERMGMSEAALKDFRDAYQELADTGALSPETSNKIFVSQHIVQMNLEAIAERHQKELMESFGTLYAAQGADSASAGYRSVYTTDMAKANPWIWAEKLRIPFTGTAKNLEEIFTGMVTYAKAETAKVLAANGGHHASHYDVAVIEHLIDTGYSAIRAKLRLDEHTPLSQADSDRLNEEINAEVKLPIFLDYLKGEDMSLSRATYEWRFNGDPNYQHTLFAEQQIWQHIDTDAPATAVGVLINNLWLAHSTDTLAEVYASARDITLLTAIPTEKILVCFLPPSVAKRSEKLRALFTHAGYAEAVSEYPHTSGVVSARSDKAAYTTAESIRIRVNLPEGKPMTDLRVFDESGVEILGTRNRYYISIPVILLPNLLELGARQLKVRANFVDGSSSTTTLDPVDLSIDTLDTLPVPNQMIINYLRSTVLPALVFDEEKGEWRATNDEGDECKIWVQNFLIPNVFNNKPFIPVNDPSNLHQWLIYNSEGKNISGVDPIADLNNLNSAGGATKQFFSVASSGDLIQLTLNNADGLDSPHTLIVDQVEENGIWVYDSNWVGRHTVGRHFLSFEYMDSRFSKATIYRVQSIYQ